MSSAQDLPFSCEYAKSGRSSCKSCRQKIDKDTLRLGIMVQSPVFDGKIPNWYHSTCFWKAARLQNIGDLHGFDKLRWEDQETVKKKITGASSSVSSGALKNPSVNDFSIEYSKSSRAACKICFAKILKNEIRISCKDYESKYGKMMGGTDAWHHLSCFADNIEKLEFYENPEKKKRKQENDLVSEEEESPKKRPKKYQNPLDMEEEALKEQNKAFWAIRDQLQRKANKKEMVSILEANGQQVPHGETRIMDSLADIMLFGPLKQCTECGNGQLVYSSSQNTYVCKGFVSEFTGCLFKTQDPARRKKFLVPPDLDQHEYFSKFKFVAGRKRIFPSQRPVSTSSQSIDGAADVADKALYGQKFVLGGEKFSRSRQEISDKIRNLGGDIVATLKDSVLAVISSDKEKGEDWKGASAEVKKLLKKAEKFNVPVVDEQFLNSLKSASQVELMIQQYSLVDWGTKEVKEKMRKSKLEKIEKSSAKSDAAWTKSVPVSQKLVMKGGAAVDPSCEAAEFTHVWKHNAGCLYTVTLNKVDVHRDINSYYKLQLLEHDKHRKYYLFRSWGRIGTTVGGTLLEEFGVEFEDAQEEFKRLYLEKTGNEWEDRKHFQKRPQKFFPVDLDYGEDEKPKKKGKVAEGSRSNLPLAVQELVKLIFDVEQMKQTMKEFEIDLKKMPLGKLSKKQIRDAYKVLGDLQKLMTDGATETQVLDASNRFYSLIPHDFGMQKPKLLDNDDIIKEKTDMLDNLLEIEVAFSILKGISINYVIPVVNGDTEKDPLDDHYEKLKTDMKVLDKQAEEFQRLVEYVKNTHGATHASYKLEVEDIFKVDREGEEKVYGRYKDLHNKMLLWHGSRLSNYAGILSQGLRIAPPEAPVTGYMFGKGIYFADMVSKSANYCHTSPQNDTGLLMLCEVVLGDMWEQKQAHYVEKLPKGKHSTKGVGMTTPDPNGNYTNESGVLIPMGKGIKAPVGQTSLLYNEYIVYDVAQVRIRYLLKTKFKYNY